MWNSPIFQARKGDEVPLLGLLFTLLFFQVLQVFLLCIEISYQDTGKELPFPHLINSLVKTHDLDLKIERLVRTR